MVGARKRKKIEDEEIGLVYRRRRRREKELEQKASGSRFPKLADGSNAKGFATLSHSNLKSWAHVSKAQGHNTRAIDTPNARNDAPAPIELLEDQTGPYVDRIKAVLVAHDVPVRIRKNGTIATEDVLGASPEYWNRDGDWKQKPINKIIDDPVVQGALALARKKHGKRLISCSLHLDEESPHIHVVAVPLVFREHAPRGRKPKDCKLDEKGEPTDYRPKVAKWTLDVSSERGRSSQLERNHDEWAEACEDIGLVRGERGSDMTLEAKRARRNRQTGRASMAEKASREKREGLERAAYQFLDEAEADRKLAYRLRQEAEVDKVAAEKARLDAEQSSRAQIELQMELDELVRKARETKREADIDRNKIAEVKKSAEFEGNTIAVALEFVADILDPDSEVYIEYVDDKMKLMGKYTSDQAATISHLPPPLYAAVAGLLSATAELSLHRKEIAEGRQQTESGRTQLDSDRQKYERARTALLGVRDAAVKFRNGWLDIPASERSPKIEALAQNAQSLEDMDFPPTFSLPGRGGAGIG